MLIVTTVFPGRHIARFVSRLLSIVAWKLTKVPKSWSEISVGLHGLRCVTTIKLSLFIRKEEKRVIHGFDNVLFWTCSRWNYRDPVRWNFSSLERCTSLDRISVSLSSDRFWCFDRWHLFPFRKKKSSYSKRHPIILRNRHSNFPVHELQFVRTETKRNMTNQ